MNSIIQFFVESHQNNFNNFSMEEIYRFAHENLSLLENLIYITLAFFLSFLLFYFFHFRLNKPLLARRVTIISLMVLMGVGWPVTLYYVLLQNLTPAVLLLGCFTLLVMNIYLFFVYWVDPFSPGKPLKHGQKILGWLVLVITLFNLLLIIAAGLAQGIVMTQAWGAKLLADQMMAAAGSLPADVAHGKIELTNKSSKNASASVFLPCPGESKSLAYVWSK